MNFEDRVLYIKKAIDDMDSALHLGAVPSLDNIN